VPKRRLRELGRGLFEPQEIDESGDGGETAADEPRELGPVPDGREVRDAEER